MTTVGVIDGVRRAGRDGRTGADRTAGVGPGALAAVTDVVAG
ncbi:MAG TPA: hypothetical protein VHW93_01650 [Acidimicrobiales bacterium]|nr:hypothetical protein [Acidimicrobiales bacterium]